MREFLITVNGKTYEVQVEEIGQGVKTTPKAAPMPAPAPAQKPEIKPLSAKTAGKTSVKSPMPGTIVKIAASVGDTVKSNTLLCILEAMKMENEIFAGTDGVVASVEVAKGASVNSGDVLFTIN
ncbi:MAG: biotin/lipoyl-binding protein [Oscillospiraceae bacterium]|jgi:biotin carboxyl carrier protein|nr:biotin/lipoyl-binding protein [Oscillospiraceae bacterium]